jgi:hypothetical protein
MSGFQAVLKLTLLDGDAYTAYMHVPGPRRMKKECRRNART